MSKLKNLDLILIVANPNKQRGRKRIKLENKIWKLINRIPIYQKVCSNLSQKKVSNDKFTMFLFHLILATK